MGAMLLPILHHPFIDLDRFPVDECTGGISVCQYQDAMD
jgi:hypothetical protein